MVLFTALLFSHSKVLLQPIIVYEQHKYRLRFNSFFFPLFFLYVCVFVHYKAVGKGNYSLGAHFRFVCKFKSSRCYFSLLEHVLKFFLFSVSVPAKVNDVIYHLTKNK